LTLTKVGATFAVTRSRTPVLKKSPRISAMGVAFKRGANEANMNSFDNNDGNGLDIPGETSSRTTRPVFLNGWKEIAGYVGRGVRTVQRWEALGLPVRRPNARLRSAVVTTAEEVDVWVGSCGNGRLQEARPASGAPTWAFAAQVRELVALREQLERLRAENKSLRQKLDSLHAPQNPAREHPRSQKSG
jgi:homoaconitase/3-isopropylmalate dehydratase large subunit